MSVYSHMTVGAVGVETRAARESDARAVTALLRGIYAEWRYFVGDSPAPERSLAARIATNDITRSFYAVATVDRAVKGWVELHRSPAWRLEHVAVLTLAVAPEARRRGIGRDLLEAGYDWCRRVGVLKVSLHVRAGNDAAVRLYLSEGFELEGRERGQIRLGPEANSRRAGGGETLAAPDSARSDAFEDNLIMGKWLDGAGP